jgi:peptide/nickel transport system ATP-binding protein
MPKPEFPLPMAGSGTAHLRPAREALLRAEEVVVEFPVAGGRVHAVSGVSVDVGRKETLALVGESGCGKSSLAMAIAQLPRPTAGRVFLEDTELTSLRGERLRRARPRIQVVFQDPIAALNPRRTVTEIVGEPLEVWSRGRREERRRLIDSTLERVGLNPGLVRDKRPHELSGGQCQRVAIARALVLDPDVLICDEPVSSLDVSIQAQVLNLLEDLKQAYGLTMLFISHDLAVVKNVADHVAVMYLGKLCEYVVNADDLYRDPAHPYTAMLLAAVPRLAPGGLRAVPMGEAPSPMAPPSGCRFRTRCPRADARCSAEEPSVRQVASGHFVACHHPLTGADAGPTPKESKS